MKTKKDDILYRSASVSVVKAFNRLVNRDLAIRKQNHGIILTEEGVKVTRAL
jgi:Mn-dependent DtxR family transcriptional regulator